MIHCGDSRKCNKCSIGGEYVINTHSTLGLLIYNGLARQKFFLLKVTGKVNVILTALILFVFFVQATTIDFDSWSNTPRLVRSTSCFGRLLCQRVIQ